MSKLTHFDDAGAAHMVDVGQKTESERVAVAAGAVEMQRTTLDAIGAGIMGKGDVLGVARLAAIQGLKRTSELIPLCHPVRVTGVEMEALTAVSIAALTIYDMCKAVDRGMRIVDVRLVEKRGGKSGTWTRND